MRKRVGILHPETLRGCPEGSTWSGRVRARWLAQVWEEAELYRPGARYEALIYSPRTEHEAARAPGAPRRVLDVFNPEWHFDPESWAAALSIADALTCSSEGLRKSLARRSALPATLIPDRLLLSAYPARKIHAGHAKKAAWHGFSTSQNTLWPLIPLIAARGISLTVLTDRLEPKTWSLGGIGFLRYRHESFQADLLQSSDYTVNAPRKAPLRSHGRKLASWALGLPVAESGADMDRFADPLERASEAARAREELESRWRIQISAREFADVVARLV